MPGLTEVMLHTGQHFDEDMSDVFFRELGIAPPHYQLNINGGRHGEMTGRMLIEIEAILVDEQPNIVLLYGDTNSTLAGALAASKLHLPIAHVEAGVRSFNRRMPEEINRILTDRVSTWLFCPTHAALTNLAHEGIASGVHHVGDVMYDAALDAVRLARVESRILRGLDLAPGGYSLATVHRPDNTDTREALARVLAYLQNAARERPIVLPLHPRTRAAAKRLGLTFDGLMVIPPVGYLDMAQLLENCATVFTDSGGVQKEAYFHRKPCITMRKETEWVETVDAGWNRLWGSDASSTTRRDIPEYGHGDAADRICAVLVGASD